MVVEPVTYFLEIFYAQNARKTIDVGAFNRSFAI
jgi:hypothetical protein